jgi:membrane fusion protein (multidrug efflux system)
MTRAGGNMKRAYLAGAAVLCVWLTACEETKEQAELPAPLVSVAELKRGDVPFEGVFVGQTLGSFSAAVKPQVSGILQSRLFEEGAYVQKGDLLFEIDAAPFKAALEQAQGQLDSAKSQLENTRREYVRTRRLLAENAVSRQTFDNAQAAYLSAKAQAEASQAAVAEACIRLGYCRVQAPFTGYTSRAVSTVGNLVSTENTLTFINQTDPIDVQFAIPGEELFALRGMEFQGTARSYRQGDTVTLGFLGGSRYAESGRLIFLDTQVDSNTSSIRAKARMPNPHGEILPGTFVVVRIDNACFLNALMVPQSAILQTEKGSCVYVLDENNRVSLVPVRLGQSVKGDFLVTEGLSEGQRVVVSGQDKVLPGGKVTPVLEASHE